MDTVPQTANCVDVLPIWLIASRHLHSHLLWTSLEPGHCHCAVCLMEPHISKPSVSKSNTGVRTLISHHRRRTLVSRKMREISTVRSESVRLIENTWVTRDAWDLVGLRTTYIPHYFRPWLCISVFIFVLSVRLLYPQGQYPQINPEATAIGITARWPLENKLNNLNVWWAQVLRTEV